MSATPPPAGFYDDPQDPARDRWWDGTAWTEVTREAEAERPGPLDPGGLVEQLPGAIGAFYDRNREDVHTAAGGALVADGLVGFGAQRQGIGGALKGVLFGAVFLAVGLLVLWLVNADAVREPVPVEATVVAMDISTTTDSDGDRSRVCMPTVEFTTADGEDVLAQPGASSTSLCTIREGDVVSIVYDATDPGRVAGFDETSDLMLRIFPWIFILAGGFMMLSSLWTFVLRATQIGAGIALIARSRAKDREKQGVKAARKTEKAAGKAEKAAGT